MNAAIEGKQENRPVCRGRQMDAEGSDLAGCGVGAPYPGSKSRRKASRRTVSVGEH